VSQKAQKYQSFDYIIVGAGSAGCVLANRLTRDPSVHVLLIEAGDWDRDGLISLPMGIKPMTEKKLYQWSDVSEPDAGLNGRIMEIPHGKVIGGGSSINYMAHTRGHPADFDRWAAQGATGWNYDQVLPFFKECETWEGGADPWRGGDGELGALTAPMDDPIHQAWFAAVRSLGYNLTPDYNGVAPEGFGPLQYSIRNGRRSSSAQAFLRPAQRRQNLTVRTNSTVTKLLFEGKRVVGVEYMIDGRREIVASTVRTVLCLGAINTPHLLMLSGVGPADHLRSMGITPIVDLPVGKNLEDHLGIAMMWRRPRPGTFHRALRFDRAVVNMLRALLFRNGPSSRLPGVIVGFLKSKPQLPQPDLQLFLQLLPPNADVWFPGFKRAYQDGFAIRAQLVGQKSRGEILLKSADPNDRPRVFYNSLSAPEDLETMREGFKRAWAIGNSPELAAFRGKPVLPAHLPNSDAEIDTFIRENAIQLYHPSSTCRMGNDDNAVVNPDLSVRGLKGLSVVDASVMPNLVSANPSVVIMMMAAKAAAMWQQAA
jgi:choline dehydrogenase-like flavoprotein